jgi:hypothetical protein
VNPWSRAEESGLDGDERSLRELFERRARVTSVGEVPPLADVLRRAAERETSMPRARVAWGAALAAACFAAVVFGHRGASSRIELRSASHEVDAGAEPAAPGAVVASWDWGTDDQACCAEGSGRENGDETLACFSPPASPAPAAPADAVCESEDTCSVGDPSTSAW